MSFKVKDVLDDVRPLVNDIESETWGDQIFFQYVNECVRLIYADHPESRVETAGTLKSYTAITTLNDTIGLDDIYRQAVVEYLAYRYHDSDGSDNRDEKRAAEHLSRFGVLIGPSK